MRRPPKPSPPLFHFVNKPALQLSAPSCPLLHTIYLFTRVATPLALRLFLSLFSPLVPSSNSLSRVKLLMLSDGYKPSETSSLLPPLQQSFLASRPPALLSQMLFFRRLKHFRFALPPGQRVPNVPRPQNCAINCFG